ncbi:MAG: TlpA family protein disulfide reductase [Muribaculaceae bacterium]|nr:TlpA family protein disulfide reductase [Muribaculaceae bacterium]MDE7143049.1 TlpA family protein disulfide reductase [Muribaculaceae bacterium]
MGAFLRRLAAVCAVVLGAVAAPGCVTEEDGDPWSIAVGDGCPAFEVTLDDGRTVGTADLAGRRTMVVFFNTACADCRRELPQVQLVADMLAAETAGDAPDAPPAVICVSRGEGAGSVARYWEEHGLTLPYSAQPDDAVYRLFARSVIPRVYIIGADLRVAAVYVESLPEADELVAAMRR